MRRFGLFTFSVLVAVAAATVLGMLLRRLPWEPASAFDAFLQFGIAGMVVGMTVGIGATVGPRPPLPAAKCLVALALVALSSGVGGFIGSLFPQVFAATDQAVREQLARRGIMAGSWFGAAAGSVIEIIHVYRMRRKAANRSK